MVNHKFTYKELTTLIENHCSPRWENLYRGLSKMSDRVQR
jgi:hypothetical protein